MSPTPSIRQYFLCLATLAAVAVGSADALAEQRTITKQHADAKVTLTLSNDQVQVAEPFELLVEVVAQAGTLVRFPDFGAKLGSLEVLNTEQLTDLPVADGRLTMTRWTLESLKSGDVVVGPIAIQLNSTTGPAPETRTQATQTQASRTQASQSQTIQTEPIRLQVRSAIEQQADPTQFRDIHAPIDIELPGATTTFGWLWLGLAAIGVVLAIAIACMLARRTRSPEPADWATLQLKALRLALRTDNSMDLPSTLQTSDKIFREFMTLQFEDFASTHTTDETLASVARLPGIREDQLERVTRLLQTADSVKYAGREITSGEMQTQLDDCLEAVDGLRQTAGTMATTQVGSH